MKQCPHCGRFNTETKTVCDYCKYPLPKYGTAEYLKFDFNASSSSKVIVGVLLGLFLGVLGLAIGLFMYDDDEAKSFLEGWITISIILTIVGIIFGIINYWKIKNLLKALGGLTNSIKYLGY